MGQDLVGWLAACCGWLVVVESVVLLNTVSSRYEPWAVAGR